MNSDTQLDRADLVEDSPIEQVINEDFIAKFEKQAELYQKRYLPICLKLTNEADWVNHAGANQPPKYSLQCSGAEKLCNPLAINWDRPMVVKHEREDEQGRFYEYEVEGIVKCNVLRRWGWFTGNCDSRDQFFVARGRFSEGDIRKAAFSNWLVNAVTRLAGIRNPTKDLLLKAGLNPESIQGIGYGTGKTPQQSNQGISEPQFKRLWLKAKAARVSEEMLLEKVQQMYKLEEMPGSEAAVMALIKRGDYDGLCAWVDRGGKDGPNGGSQKPAEREPGWGG